MTWSYDDACTCREPDESCPACCRAESRREDATEWVDNLNLNRVVNAYWKHDCKRARAVLVAQGIDADEEPDAEAAVRLAWTPAQARSELFAALHEDLVEARVRELEDRALTAWEDAQERKYDEWRDR